MRVGLTGGVGSGKSTVSRLLAERGAVVIDADALAREVVRAGTVGFEAVVAEFGPSIVGTDGELDRPALAAIVFNDSGRRDALNAIVHPLVGQRTIELMAAAPSDAIVVYDVPLLVESDLAAGFDTVVVVEAPVEVRLARLAARGMPEKDARERIAVQSTNAQRRAVADHVVDNSGTLAELTERVERLWTDLRQAVAGGLERPTGIG